MPVEAPTDSTFILKKPTNVQEKLLRDYRLTDAFRRSYGEFFYSYFPDGIGIRSAVQAIQRFKELETVDIHQHKELIVDMLYTKDTLGFYYWEYFAYGLEGKSIAERLEFQPEVNNLFYYRKLNTDRESIRTLNDKYLAYQRLKPYYKREILRIDGEDCKEAFFAFCENNRKFVIKPVESALGKGVQVIDSATYDSAEAMFQKLLALCPYLCEEVIVTDDSFTSIHHSSVNSLRVFTYNRDDKPDIFCAWLKAGRGGAVVDNGSSGGMLAGIDIRTGTVVTDARDEAAHVYAAHPDTGAVFQGFQIKHWDELVDTCKKLAVELPGMKLIGWDLALSADRGWQVIEGNAFGMFNLMQVASQKGIRRELEDFVNWKELK